MKQVSPSQHLSLSDVVASSSQFKGECGFRPRTSTLNFLYSVTETCWSFSCLTSELGGATLTTDKLNECLFTP